MKPEEIMQSLREKIKKHKYKCTKQREDILRVFISGPGKHLSAEDVYHAVKKLQPEIGLATVYRTLDLFTELGLVKRLDFGDGRARYELFNEELPHFHHHLICLRCGEIREFKYDMLEALEAAIDEEEHFQVVDHMLKFYGYCRACRRLQNAGDARPDL